MANFTIKMHFWFENSFFSTTGTTFAMMQGEFGSMESRIWTWNFNLDGVYTHGRPKLLTRVLMLFYFYFILFYFILHITNHLKNLYVKFNIIYAPSLGRLWYNQSCIHLSSLIRDVAFLISSTRHTTYSLTHLLPYCRLLLLVVEQLCSGLIVLTVSRNTYFMEACFDIYIKYSDPDKQAML